MRREDVNVRISVADDSAEFTCCPIDTLKVDSSFVSRIGEDKENLEIVIAEGVEIAEQLS